MRPGDPNLVGGGGIYTDEFVDTFNYKTHFYDCWNSQDWGYCAISEHAATSDECLDYQFERNLLCCNDFDRQATCNLEPHIENQCMCRAGYELSDVGCVECTDGNYKAEISNTTDCEPCPSNTYTEGTGNVECKTCPVNSLCTQDCFSIDTCICVDGYYKNSFLTPFECTICPEGSYCTNQIKEKCPGYRTSLEGAKIEEECFCSPGMYLNTTDYCELCEPGNWCADDGSNPCPEHSGAGYGNADLSHCTCNAGYWRNCVLDQSGAPEYISHVDSRQECWDLKYEVWDYVTSFKCQCQKDNSLYGPCEVCKPNLYCTGDHVLHCPEHSTTIDIGGADSFLDCVCTPGYYKVNRSEAN